ncbi:LacI family DNA-binding transcriptional regulator [Pseudactinotalea sp. HY160]|uniref:LacI family DNA-binding transcriptional regulator n=1 Tax=Pseudactinotalea sp. HY160 TaxID=2654490 RepID=UPI00130FF4CD|nr:LacI family DNA-binding transcriptional regulator [Pseudactinotalea sp. HY160]
MATLNDVAIRAGVSKATASRALNHPALVAPATAERVRVAARELDFVPNRLARQLALGRTGIVSMLFPTLSNAFFTPIIAGAQDRAEELGLYLTVTAQPLAAAAELSHLADLARQVDGFVVVAPRGDDALVTRAMALRPSVLVDREIDGHTSVVADTASAFAALMRGLAAAGHRRVVFIGGPDRSWQNVQRTRAIEHAARTGGVDITVLGPAEPNFLVGQSLAQEVRASGATAVLPYAADLGLGVLFELVRSGHSTLGPASSSPGLIEVVGVPDSPAVAVDGHALGREALDRLHERLAEDPHGSPPASTQQRLPVPISQAGPHPTHSPSPAHSPG